MEFDDLLPCPFCSGKNIQLKYWLEQMGQEFFFKCNDCYCFGPRFLGKDEAIRKAHKAWNNRNGKENV